MSCIFKVEILLPENVVEFFYHRLDRDQDGHNLNEIKDKLFKRYEILNNASFKMVWIDNAGDRINILEEDDLRTFVEMKGSKVIVLADPSNNAIIVNQFTAPQDVNGSNTYTCCDQFVKNSELNCGGCNVELRGIRFQCTDCPNFYLCFLCGMSKKQYNLTKTIHTVQPLNESHTMITSSSQTKEISEWMENSRKRVTDLINEGISLEETLISILRKGTTAVKTVPKQKELLQDNLRGIKPVKEDEKDVEILAAKSKLNISRKQKYSGVPKLQPPLKFSLATLATSSDDSLSVPENVDTVIPSLAAPANSSYVNPRIWQWSHIIPSISFRESPKDLSDHSSSEEEESKNVHEHPKDSSDDSSPEEEEANIFPSKSSTASRDPKDSSDDSSSDEDGELAIHSSEDSSSDEDEVKEGPVKLLLPTFTNSSDDSSSDEDEVEKIPVKPPLATLANISNDIWYWQGPRNVPSKTYIKFSNESSDDSSSDEEESNNISPKSSAVSPKDSSGSSSSEEEEIKKIHISAKSSSDDSSSDEEENQVHAKASSAISLHTSSDKSSDKEESRKGSLPIPISSVQPRVQPTQIDTNMNLPFATMDSVD